MRITMIGTGYVGLVTGACFSEFGVDVTCVDMDEGKISRLQKGEIPIFEPGLESLVERNARAGRLHFTTDLGAAVAQSDVVFIAVGTPTCPESEGRADLSYVLGAARDIAHHLTGYTVVVTKSTVPVGTGRQVVDVIRGINPDADFDIASNPEFLREGSAIDDFMRPDRVVVGVESDRAAEYMRRLYKPFYLRDTPMVVTGLETAELAKYASNSFLATKIAFINDIADLCERVGGNVKDVATAMGLDTRIGDKFLNPGPGFGGSCFPKDALAFAHTGRDMGVPQRIVEQVIEINENRKAYMADKIADAVGGNVAGKTIAVLGVTFKPNTNDMRESPSLVILPRLMKAGAKIRAFDPEGMEVAKTMMQGITWCTDAYNAAEGADVLVILTEWNQFRALNFSRLKENMASPILVDLRNVYKLDDIPGTGFDYYSIGRSPVLDARMSMPSSEEPIEASSASSVAPPAAAE